MAAKTTPANTAPVLTDEWAETRDITLPRAHKGEDPYYAVWINGRGYQIPKGKTSKVPLPIYERLTIIMDAENAAEDFAAEVPNEG